jgi:hypothetical protein
MMRVESSYPPVLFDRPVEVGRVGLETSRTPIGPHYLEEHFSRKKYWHLPSKSVENTEKDTEFITAGVQTALQALRKGEVDARRPIYIAQPVVRTQFRDSISEGSSVAFTNISTILFEGSADDHEGLVGDWMGLFEKLGIDTTKLSTRDKEYERSWGDLVVKGHKVFYSYNGTEIGDSAYLEAGQLGVHNTFRLSDVGFGLERIKWLISGGSYFELSPDRDTGLDVKTKGFCSTLGLLAINGIKPSNRGAGYRFRQFSKSVVTLDNSRQELVETEIREWMRYWAEWSSVVVDENAALMAVKNENDRNTNRLILDMLKKEGLNTLVEINQPTVSFIEKLVSNGWGSKLDSILRQAQMCNN